jgi:hypothetical protein
MAEELWREWNEYNGRKPRSKCLPPDIPILSAKEFDRVVNSKQTPAQKKFLQESIGTCRAMTNSSNRKKCHPAPIPRLTGKHAEDFEEMVKAGPTPEQKKHAEVLLTFDTPLSKQNKKTKRKSKTEASRKS